MWPALPPEALRITLSLPFPSPSLNEIRGVHWAAYRKVLKGWQLRVFTALNGRRPAKPLHRAILEVDRYEVGEGLDWDNVYGGLKPILDCLVMPTTKNPFGLGLIVDDSPSHVPLPPFVRQFSSPRNESRTEIRIYDATALNL